MNCVIYTRVSTEDQEDQNQLPAIKDLIERRGFNCVGSYSEHASAWKSGHQKELKKLIEDAQAQQFQFLVVWSIDRLTREGPGRILQLCDRFEQLGVSVISVQEPWLDVGGDLKPLLLAVFGWVANFESRRRSERTKAGIARKKATGKLVGRHPGSRDRKKRSRNGYLLRHARERIQREKGD